LEKADFKTKRQIIELLEIGGKVAFEKTKGIASKMPDRRPNRNKHCEC